MPPEYLSTTASSGDEVVLQRQHKSSKEFLNDELSERRSSKKLNEESSVEPKSYVIKQKEHVGAMDKTGKIVAITSSKFKPDSVVIFEGESITFQLEPEAEHLINYPVQQVYKNKGHLQEVIGGFHSSNVLQATQTWTQEFSLANDYLFQFASHKPLKVVVKQKPFTDVNVTDKGFSRPMIRLYKGDTVRWVWSRCAIAHTVVESTYCEVHGGYSIVQKGGNQLRSGTYFKTFSQPGIYYFMTEIVGEDNQNATCVVQVLERKREHFVELKDGGFSRGMFDISKGERVWIQWKAGSKEPNLDSHSITIRRICQPGIPDNADISDIMLDDPSEPSASGVLAYVFQDVGVFEICDKESPAMRCVVAVKATNQQHVVRVSKQEFMPGNCIYNKKKHVLEI